MTTPLVFGRTLRVIAKDIREEWSIASPSVNVQTYARPYLEAISTMDYVEDMYGAEYGDMIVAYLLNNLTGWRGPQARRIKAELKRLLADYNNGVRYRDPKRPWPTDNGISV